MPTFFTLESMKQYGIPVEVDGEALTYFQAQRMVGLIGRAMDEAGHTLEDARKIAVKAFRKLYEKKDDGWSARRVVQLGTHGGKIQNRHHNAERRQMPRTRSKPKQERSPAERVLDGLNEAGARNNKKDNAAIADVVKLAVGQLNKDAALQVLKDNIKKLKG
jgi:hypothetical protein